MHGTDPSAPLAPVPLLPLHSQFWDNKRAVPLWLFSVWILRLKLKSPSKNQTNWADSSASGPPSFGCLFIILILVFLVKIDLEKLFCVIPNHKRKRCLPWNPGPPIHLLHLKRWHCISKPYEKLYMESTCLEASIWFMCVDMIVDSQVPTYMWRSEHSRCCHSSGIAQLVLETGSPDGLGFYFVGSWDPVLSASSVTTTGTADLCCCSKLLMCVVGISNQVHTCVRSEFQWSHLPKGYFQTWTEFSEGLKVTVMSL